MGVAVQVLSYDFVQGSGHLAGLGVDAGSPGDARRVYVGHATQALGQVGYELAHLQLGRLQLPSALVHLALATKQLLVRAVQLLL